MQMEAVLPNGDYLPMYVLVDTGAQANLIKSELVPPLMATKAHNPVRLVAANQQVLLGGDKTVSLEVGFSQFKGGRFLQEPLFLGADFYLARLDVDAMLSYPWLLENKIGMFPHRGALALEGPELTLLYGWTRKMEKSKQPRRRGRFGRERRCRMSKRTNLWGRILPARRRD